MWVPDEGEALFREYRKKVDGFREDAQDILARYARWFFGLSHFLVLLAVVGFSSGFEVSNYLPLSLPFTTAVLAFVSIFSLNMIRALSDKERDYEQAALEYSLKLTETIYSDTLSDNYKRIVGARIREMFKHLEHLSRPVVLTNVWTKCHTKVSLLDLLAALIVLIPAHSLTGHTQAGLFLLSLLLTLFALLVTVALTAKYAFEYY